MILQAFDPSINPLNNNEWAFPLTEVIHIASFAMSVGTIAMVDLRLLGLAMRGRTVARVLRDTELWTMTGIALAMLSGGVLVTMIAYWESETAVAVRVTYQSLPGPR